MSKYKLDMDQMIEAESVIEAMENDPEAIAFELVWRRHAMAEIASFIKRHGIKAAAWKEIGEFISE